MKSQKTKKLLKTALKDVMMPRIIYNLIIILLNIN